MTLLTQLAKGTTFKVAFAKASTTETLTFDGSAETNGKVSVTGASGADIITGSSMTPLLVALVPTTSLVALVLTSSATGAEQRLMLVAANDTIADFVTGTDDRITASVLATRRLRNCRCCWCCWHRHDRR